VGLFMSLGQFALLYTAFAVGMPAGLASLVLQAQVGLTVVIAALALRERPSGPQVAGVLVGAVGLGVVAVGRAVTTPALGLVLVVAAATSWAVGNVVARRASGRTRSLPGGGGVAPPRGGFGAGLSMTVWSALVVPLPLLGLALVVNGPDAVAHALTHLTAPAVLSTVYTAWLASLVGYGIWNTLLARHPAAAVVPFTMLVPVVGLTTAWLVQGETPNAWEAAGGLLLLLGVAITTGVLDPRRRSRPDPGRGPAEESATSADPAPTSAR